MQDPTRKFAALDSKMEMKEILSSVYNSLMVKGYNPINQIVGYILSEDPTGVFAALGSWMEMEEVLSSV